MAHCLYMQLIVFFCFFFTRTWIAPKIQVTMTSTHFRSQIQQNFAIFPQKLQQTKAVEVKLNLLCHNKHNATWWVWHICSICLPARPKPATSLLSHHESIHWTPQHKPVPAQFCPVTIPVNSLFEHDDYILIVDENEAALRIFNAEIPSLTNFS